MTYYPPDQPQQPQSGGRQQPAVPPQRPPYPQRPQLGPPQYGPPQQYPPQQWQAYPPNGHYGPPPKEPMPVFGAILMMVGGLLGLLGGILPWVTVLGTSISGFGLANAIENFGGDAGYTETAIWVVAVLGVVVLVCGGVFLAQKDNPTWAVTIASIAAGLATLSGIFDFVNLASQDRIGVFGIGMWCYLLSGVVGFIGLVGAGTKKF